MRTQDEIVSRIRERGSADLFGWEIAEYAEYLDWQHAKEFVNDDVVEADWMDKSSEHTREHMIAVMRDYMPFAIGKARNHRGLSANRSLMHFIAWTWLAGDDALSNEIIEYEDEEYGMAMLKRIASYYNFPFDA